MHVLHICGDYPFTPIYQSLLRKLSERGAMMQSMYVPLQSNRPFSNKFSTLCSQAKVVYSYDFNVLDRLFFYSKRDKIARSIESTMDMNRVSAIHAHYLFSAGGAAYELSKRHKRKFIVAVRSCDVNVFFKYQIHLRRYGIDILVAATKIIFLSPAHRDFVIYRYIPDRLRRKVLDKSSVIPNGIADFWLLNRYSRCYAPKKQVTLLYVGEISRNKNLPTIIRVTDLLRKRGLDARLLIIGDGSDAARIRRMAHHRKSYTNMVGFIESQEKLLCFYRSADIFIMPSKTETFGLVYIEAMTQGLPLIYTKGQGIDGYFPRGAVGFACNPFAVEEMVNSIEFILHHYLNFSSRCIALTEGFSWEKVAEQYEIIYASLL